MGLQLFEKGNSPSTLNQKSEAFSQLSTQTGDPNE
jgi:hypothetical protein